MVRGNHEMCNRSGQGWYRFLDTNPYDTTGHHTCDSAADDNTAGGGNYNNPWLVQINSSTQIIAFDTANGKPSPTSTPTGPGSTFFTTYTSQLNLAGSLLGLNTLPFNLWANHHPILGYSTGSPPATSIPLFTNVMAATYPNTYLPPAVNLALHGHTHDYQAINFAQGTTDAGASFTNAATLVSGNAGDLLDTTIATPVTSPALPPLTIGTSSMGAQTFATADAFGYMVLQFNAGPPATWVSTEYRPDNSVRNVCTISTSGQMSCTTWGTIVP
jgi:hypothetical protein